MSTRQESQKSSARAEPEEFSRRAASKLSSLAQEVTLHHGQTVVTAAREQLPDVVGVLKGDPELSCDYFTFLSGVDWEDEGFEVIVALFSLANRNTVVVKTRLPPDDPRMPTLTSVFAGSNWHEREAAEMFGIDFEGHPNLVKLYLPEDFEGHPLRKSFKLASRTHKAWPGAKDPAEAEAGGR